MFASTTDELKRLQLAVDQTFAILADIAPQIIYESEFSAAQNGTINNNSSGEETTATAHKSLRNITTAAARDEQDLLSLETLLVSRTRSGANLLDETGTKTVDSGLPGDDEELFDIPLSKPFDGPANTMWLTHQAPDPFVMQVTTGRGRQHSSGRTQTLGRSSKIRPPVFDVSTASSIGKSNTLPRAAMRFSNVPMDTVSAVSYQMLPPIGPTPGVISMINGQFMSSHPPPMRFYPIPAQPQMIIGSPLPMQFMPSYQQR